MYISVSGVSGNVSIKGKGDREADYALLDMDPKTGRFDVRSITYITKIQRYKAKAYLLFAHQSHILLGFS